MGDTFELRTGYTYILSGDVGNYTISATDLASATTSDTIPNNVKFILQDEQNPGVSVPSSILSSSLLSTTEFRFEFECKYVKNIELIDSDFMKMCMKNIIVLEKFVDLSEYAFYECAALISAEFPKMTGSIYGNAFKNCTALTEAKFPKMTLNIGDNAFNGCDALAEAEFPKMTGSIGISAFNGCAELKDAKFPEMGESIGTNAFFGCLLLTEAIFPKMTGSIGYNAFKNCIALTKAEFPIMNDSVNNIAFDGCTELKLLDLSHCETELTVYSLLNTLFGVNMSNTAISYGGNIVFKHSISSGGSPVVFDFKNICAPMSDGPDPDVKPLSTGTYIFKHYSSSGDSVPWLPASQYRNVDWSMLKSTTILPDPLTVDDTISKEKAFKKYVTLLFADSDVLERLLADYHLMLDTMDYKILDDNTNSISITDVPNPHQLMYANSNTVTITIGDGSYTVDESNMFVHVDQGEGHVLIGYPVRDNEHLLVFYLENQAYKLSDRNLRLINELTKKIDDINNYQSWSSIVIAVMIVMIIIFCIYLYRKS